ncbi:hypothetical protein GGI43DRAFT_284026 [Trichoderma evansii]
MAWFLFLRCYASAPCPYSNVSLYSTLAAVAPVCGYAITTGYVCIRKQSGIEAVSVSVDSANPVNLLGLFCLLSSCLALVASCYLCLACKRKKGTKVSPFFDRSAVGVLWASSAASLAGQKEGFKPLGR